MHTVSKVVRWKHQEKDVSELQLIEAHFILRKDQEQLISLVKRILSLPGEKDATSPN